jgi:excisionase family DNA binding protein
MRAKRRDELLTAEEAAKLLGLEPTLVRVMLRAVPPRWAHDWRFSKKLLLDHIVAGGSPTPIVQPPVIAEARPRSRVLTVEQAAELLQVRPKTVRALAHERKIPAVKVGKPWRFDEDLLREWLARRAAENEARMPAPSPAPPHILHSVRLKADEGSLADRLDRMLTAPAETPPRSSPKSRHKPH